MRMIPGSAASKATLRVYIDQLQYTIDKLMRENKKLRAAIRCQEIKPPHDVNDDLTTEFAIKIATMKKRERVIARAFMAVLEELPEGSYPTKDDKGTILFGRQIETNSISKVECSVRSTSKTTPITNR